MNSFRIITSVKNNTDKVQLDLSRIASFEKILGILEGQLLDGRIFQVIYFLSLSAKCNRKISSRIVLSKSSIRQYLSPKMLVYKKNTS